MPNNKKKFPESKVNLDPLAPLLRGALASSGIEAEELSPPNPAKAKLACQRAAEMPPGIFTRRTREGNPELLVNLCDGMANLMRVFPQPIQPQSDRYTSASSLRLLEDCSGLHYWPISGRVSNGNHVKITVQIRPTATSSTPHIEFLGETPSDFEVMPSAHGKGLIVLHFTCSDPKGEVVFDCPDQKTLRLELRGSIFPA